MYVDPSGHSILAALLITAGVGALLGGTIGGGLLFNTLGDKFSSPSKIIKRLVK
jgi:hypothetical protein